MGRLALRRAIEPRVRLEVIDSCGARTACIFLYGSLVAAIALLVILKLGLTYTGVGLDGVALCVNGSGVVVPGSGGISSSGCTYVAPSPDAPNTTAWRGTVSGLSALDGDVKVTLEPLEPVALPLSVAFVFNAELRGRSVAGRDNLVMSVVNATATLQCSAAPGSSPPWSCAPITLLDTSVLTNGLGSGGFTAYTATVTYPGAPRAGEGDRSATLLPYPCPTLPAPQAST